MTSDERPTKTYVQPGRRAYPLNDKTHARTALERVAQHGTGALRKQVRDAMANRYPAIKESSHD